MTTGELFRQDHYLRQCSARITAVTEQGLILDQSVFYPLGGGQPGDGGTLRCANGTELDVIDTRRDQRSTEIVHQLSLADASERSTWPRVGDRVELVLDWPRRYHNMRLHTALHLLGATVPFPVTGGNIGEKDARLDFDMPQTPDIGLVQEQINQRVAQAAKIDFEWITDAEMAANMDLVRTLSVKPPMGQGRVRILTIAGIDRQPCGGTHVANTAEVGCVRVVKTEKKGKHNRRIRIALID